MEGPLVLFLGSKVAAKYSVLLVELRALALAVLAVQVCRERLLAIIAADSYRSLRCRCNARALTALLPREQSRRGVTYS